MHSLLTTLAVVFVLLWALGLGTSFTLGGLIHVMFLLALASMLMRVVFDQREFD